MKRDQILKLTQEINMDARWDKRPWREAPALQIDQYCGERPDHFPCVQAWLAYDDQALYAIFQVQDRYVRALAAHYQDQVSEDSCVEFFFTPGQDISQGYFNLEVNCGGTALFYHQKGRKIDDRPISKTDFAQVQMAHTLPKIVEPEIEEPVTWAVEYRLPFSILSNYAQVHRPAPGVKWRANLYKCADHSSHPHWLSWSPVDTPQPDFHRPEFFGTLLFQ
jgi:hypothetical protein